jgi:hypothetical protein
MKPKRLSRRTLLRGAGVGGSIFIGLPVLEAMLDGQGRFLGSAQGQAAPELNLLTFFVPNGVYEDTWWPQGTGRDYTLSRCLMPLASFKQDFTLIRGLRKAEAFRNQNINNDAHQRGHASFGTGGSLAGQVAVEFGSFDQLVAREFGQTTKFTSLPVSLGGVTGEVSDHISWVTGTQPAPAERDPAQLFARLFGEPTQDGSLVDYRHSILDFAGLEATRLAASITSADKSRLEEYLTSVRELEKEIQAVSTGIDGCVLEGGVDARLSGPPLPIDNGRGGYFNDRAQLLLRLQVLAFSCGLTRVGSFMLASRSNKRQFPWLGAEDPNDGHHGISHLTTAEGRETQTRIVIDEMEQFAYLLGLMQAINQGGRTLLDNTLIFFAHECGMGDYHEFNNTPVLLAGHAAGRLQLGEYIQVPNRTPYSNVIVTVLNILGLPTTTFGVFGNQAISQIV